jgi:phage major head subunit gpT-like protein
MSNGTQGGRSLNAQKIEAAYVGFHKLFNDRLQKADSIFNRLAHVERTDQLLDRQVWLTGLPMMRRWVGDKTLHKLSAESHPITTAPYEASLEVSKHDILNDRLGLYRGKINSLADSYGWALDNLVVGMLAAGIQGTALGTTYDGQNLIDTDHTALSGGGASQSNKVTGALSSTTYNTAWTRYLAFQDENGVPVNAAGRRMTLVVGPAWREVARDIIDQQTLANGEQNMDRSTSDLIVTPWIRDATIDVNGVAVDMTGLEWFLIPSDSTAILLQIKRDVEFLSVETGEFAFRTGKYLYGTEAEFGAAYGLWQDVVGGPGA